MAHKDRLIRLNGDKLIGLPEEYQPASFDGNVLSISGNKLTFPSCIKKSINFKRNKNLLILSSWYHSRSTLPPYISFANKNNSRLSLLLDMTSLAPIPTSWGYGNSATELECLNKFKVVKESNKAIN